MSLAVGTEIIVAVLALIGTTIGSLAGIRASNRLVEHRLNVLEKKVDKHNQIVERLLLVEAKVSSHEERIEDLDHTVKKSGAVRVIGMLGKDRKAAVRETIL